MNVFVLTLKDLVGCSILLLIVGGFAVAFLVELQAERRRKARKDGGA